ncbi:MAG: monovalent cation/H(+) antiporter subunit G [Acholeplasmataceae bacterium]
MTVISYILFIIGGLFYFLGGLGVLRMPDAFNRIQAGTKATTLGTFSVLLGLIFVYPNLTAKIIIIIVFIAISNPVGSSVLAKAIYKSQGAPNNITIDDLKDAIEEENKHD